ncbi:A disintegrin and metalloproteinase with thrombospondin motifs 7 isoform X2 [Dasypus novemcinctus]|uniref:A disintegrin and metalloproteinase with thrombospondin motifs 7 isoform X2 n=1 Tax=Dasypus novemcinctus TaxID=9361 RepID=UPI00265DFF47|nr:A disintegrin and metalloproteinase with thrombospondin motifs 7 isoform X2 [Dasypus novemcinctus]
MPHGRSPRSPAPLLRPLLLLLCALAPSAWGPAPERAAEAREALDIVHPVRVDAGGSFLSYDLWPRALRKRDLSARLDAPAFYQLQYRGRELRFNLTTNLHLLAPSFVSETRRRGGLSRAYIRTGTPACHLLGEVQDPELEGGLAAISACNGLKGVFQLSSEDYFIEPMDGAPARPGRAQPHVVYKRQAPERPAGQGASRAPGTCGVQESPESELQRERWEQRQQWRRPRPRRLHQRSVSKEKWVETLVVADAKMVEYHGQPHVENYLLTVMNMVAGLFHDPNIGNPIHITIVRLILLEDEEEDLKITHHADNTLRSFCKWQKSINMKGDAHPLHHDAAILLTRKDLCSNKNWPCETLGLSHVAGMCQPHLSCNINEDTGLPLAFTVAHELGHSFGIQHDGRGNDCEPLGKQPFIMSPQLLYKAVPLTWSRCSREYITRFLDRGWGLCLDDLPSKEVIDFPIVLPGILYDVNHQCRLQYGASSVFCDDIDNVCHTLWCSVGTTCHSKLDTAVDGTRCGENKWCLNGECVPVGFRPKAVDGSWSGWSAWSVCSRSCGVGVQSVERQCTQPAPKYKGRYCVGERKRYRLCNLQSCPPGHPSFRQVQCSHFDAMLYKGQLHTWVPVVSDVNPCELHCRPSNKFFAEKLRDAVVDGTPCHQGQASRDLCINGICKVCPDRERDLPAPPSPAHLNVGCDFEIDSGAMEDRCGVCRGNGSTCHTVSRTFEEADGLGYVDVGLLPAGAREIRIEEVAEAANFLALRSEHPDKYFLNGGWTIQWNGDYQVAGTTFTYARSGNWENLTSPGPTMEPVWIQLLFLESNPGVRYKYTIHREVDGHGEAQQPEFSWHYGPWTECTVTCGTGTQRQSVYCSELQASPVDATRCDPLSRPDDRHRKCSEEPCPARWWAGEWQPCSRSCGPGGVARRSVLCIRSVGQDEQSALAPPACERLPQPPTESPCNRDVPCPATWAVGNWSQCSATCGAGTRHRVVLCTYDTGVPCNEAQRPASEAACPLLPCPRTQDLLGPEGSGSGSSSHELFNEVDFTPRLAAPRPPTPSSPRPASLGNAITEEDLELGQPGPVFVDDFYYDYNFIDFHEDLSYKPFEEPDPGQAGMGNWTPPSPSSPAETPTGTPRPATGPPGDKEEGVLGDWSPAPGPSQAATSPAPPLEQAPGNLLLNFLSEEDMSVEAPGLQLPSLPWSPASGGGMETTATPSSQKERLGGEDSQSQTPPWWERTNEVSEDEALDHRAPRLPQRPSSMLPPSPSISTTTPSPGPGVVELSTGGARAQDPAPQGGLEPVGGELWPTVGAAPHLPPATAILPKTLGRAHPLEPGIPTFATPGLIPQDLQIPAVPGTFLPPVLAGLVHTPWMTAPSPGPSGHPEHPSPEALPSSVLPSMPAQDSPTNSSRAEAQLPDPSPAEEGPPVDLLAARNASWEVGNWSQCSTTCGLGAIWRPVRCSSGRDEDCAPAGRPQPARHCHLRPCASWHTGNWSKCSRSCGGGSSVRDVQCMDMRDLRPLRPFHCQPGPAKPPARRPCGAQSCLSWYISSWRECSEACGGGEQQRLVTCPEPGLCEEALRPNATQPCNTHPCTQWVVGPWSQCSAPCGGGVQRRLVKCVNTQTGLPEEDSGQCSHEAWPESSQPCSTQDCGLAEPLRCERDRLSFGFCETLRLLGRCQLPTVRLQCCRSCPPPGRGAPSRGRQQVARH